MTDLHENILSLGIEPSALTTTSLTLNEDFDWSDGHQISKGFVARQSVEVKVSLLSVLPSLLDVAVPPPASYPSNPDLNALKVSVSGLRFDLNDRTQLEASCFKKAVLSALLKIDAAAQAAGVSVVKVLSIVDSGARAEHSPPCGAGGVCYAQARAGGGDFFSNSGGANALNFDLMAGRASEKEFAARTPINGGLVQVVAGVTMTVEIRTAKEEEEETAVVAPAVKGGLRS